MPFAFNRYSGLPQMLEKNLYYLASLVALDQWYRYVRRDFFYGEELGYLLYNGALDNLSLARKERISRLKAVAEKVPESTTHDEHEKLRNRKLEFYRNVDEMCHLFESDLEGAAGRKYREAFLEGLELQKRGDSLDYIRVIQGLPKAVSLEGTAWLQAIVEDLCQKAAQLLPSMNLFGSSN